ncbi:AAA family ATPase [Psychrobacter sp. UBA3480]|uniref:ATP-dependent nuclease n=1 Tax=Psychrobacter sp. UBA3480 TaxID=1947350 RepID=UPI0025F3FF35|nr:AAA family ATPase [Psychrobacter sp. UBA3480]
MYISQLKITNYRSFKDITVEFNDGINAIIGSNNSGKSNLLRALSIIFDKKSTKKLGIDDFCKFIDEQYLIDVPPKITIEATIKKGDDDTATEDDISVLANWLTILDDNYEAVLTYEFFLPEKHEYTYKTFIEEIVNRGEDEDQNNEDISNKIWKMIQKNFLRFYKHKIWVGDVKNQSTLDPETLDRFDYQFLDAIRDVERDMLSGKNSLLKEVIDFFMDYDIKSDSTLDKKAQNVAINTRRDDFAIKSNDLLNDIHARIKHGKKEILSYATQTGASFNNALPNFEGALSELEIYSVLQLIVEYETGIKIPARNNGLGYNNLIYMSLLLAKMQVNANVEHLDSNAKVFSMLIIEEPESHLHPSMQFKLLKFLENNRKAKKVRQIFVTTHSTHITSAVTLDNIICLYEKNDGTDVAYPAKTFTDEHGNEVISSKQYIERFLDAVKSDILFSDRVLFVEGIAEQLLISIFSRYLDKSLEDYHISIVNIGGRYFNHFFYLFNEANEYAIPKKIVCLTDKDPVRRDKNKDRNFKTCYPYEFNIDNETYDYDSNNVAHASSNILIFKQDDIHGKTLEYELAYLNPSLKTLITESTKNKPELNKLMDLYDDQESTVQQLIDVLRGSVENTRIETGINSCSLTDDEKKRSIIATRYLNSVSKGENALELAIALQSNLFNKGNDLYVDVVIPPYIQEALEVLCQ